MKAFVSTPPMPITQYRSIIHSWGNYFCINTHAKYINVSVITPEFFSVSALVIPELLFYYIPHIATYYKEPVVTIIPYVELIICNFGPTFTK